MVKRDHPLRLSCTGQLSTAAEAFCRRIVIIYDCSVANQSFSCYEVRFLKGQEGSSLRMVQVVSSSLGTDSEFGSVVMSVFM